MAAVEVLKSTQQVEYLPPLGTYDPLGQFDENDVGAQEIRHLADPFRGNYVSGYIASAELAYVARHADTRHAIAALDVGATLDRTQIDGTHYKRLALKAVRKGEVEVAMQLALDKDRMCLGLPGVQRVYVESGEREKRVKKNSHWLGESAVIYHAAEKAGDKKMPPLLRSAYGDAVRDTLEELAADEGGDPVALAQAYRCFTSLESLSAKRWGASIVKDIPGVAEYLERKHGIVAPDAWYKEAASRAGRLANRLITGFER